MKARYTPADGGGNTSPDSGGRQVEQTTNEHEARLRALFDTMTEGVVLIAPDGQVVEANAAAGHILGVRQSEIIGRNYMSPDWKILRRDGTPMPAEETAGPRAMKEGRPIKDVVMGVERPDGSVAWIRVNASPLLNASGEVDGMVGTFADITESWRAEEKHRMVLDTALDGFGIIDLGGRPLEFNDSYCRMVGYTLEELLTMSISDIVVEAPEETAQRLKTIREQGYSRFESRHRRKDGTMIDVEISANYFDAEGGQIVVFVRDVSERKRGEQALAESELKHRTLAENVPQKMFLKDRSLVYLSCNSKYAQDLGIKPEEIPGHTDFDFYPRELAEKYRADDRRVIEKGNPERIEERYVEHGQERVVETFKTPIRDASGEVAGVLGVFHDITEHKRAEEALWESEARYRQLTDSAGQGIVVVQDDLIRFINRKVEELSGYSSEELLSRHFTDFIHPPDREMMVDGYRNRLKGEVVPETYEFRIAGKDGVVRWAELTAAVISWDDRPAVLCLMSDTTERKKAEAALRQSEERYRLIAENTSDSIWTLDSKLLLSYQSPAAERLFGYTLEEWESVGWEGFVHRDDLHIVTNAITGLRDGRLKDSARDTIRVRDRQGHEMWAEVVCSPIRSATGDFAGVVGVTRDVTERMRTEQQLLEYKAAVEQSAEGIALADMDGYIRFVNEAWARMHGRSVEEVTGKHLSIFHTLAQMRSEVIPFNCRLMETGSHRGEVWHVRKDGQAFPTFMTTTVLKGAGGRPFAMLALMRDITEQKAAERQRREQEIAEARAEQLGESRRRIIAAQEELRRDIAGKLHGTVQNRLILLGHKLAELEARAESETMAREMAEARQKLEELQNEQIRPISHRLFPSILRLGLCVGLESLTDEYSAELSIDLQVSKQLRAREQADRKLIPDNVKLALYRIAEEALTNTLKHTAKVTSIVVKLSLSDGGILRLTVSDDGAGFGKAASSAGIGLAIMSDYAAAAGGSCVIKGIPGKGTRVRAEVPIAGHQAGRAPKDRPSG